MAGGYTHLTLVRSALAKAMNIDGLDGVLANWGHFTYMGGVSPDYPYLAMDDSWADLMHKGKTHLMIQAAVPMLFEKKSKENRSPDEDDAWQQQLAWLLGFVAHIVADVTIHPVVNIKVGKYEDNKVDHRICEMGQDVFIYNFVTKLDLHLSDIMKTEILRCASWINVKDEVKEIWSLGMEKAYDNPPSSLRINEWNLAFLALIGSAEKSGSIPVLGRKLVGDGKAYPPKGTPTSDFCFGLEAPSGKSVDANEQPLERSDERDFEAIFQKALGHILEAWTVLRDDLFTDDAAAGDKHAQVFGDWSLDTGIDNQTKLLRLWPFNEKLVRS